MRSVVQRTAAFLALFVIADPAGAIERTVTLMVENMTCAACPIIVRTAIETVPGVREVQVDFDARAAMVTFDDALATPDAIAEASGRMGFPAKIKD